MESRRHPCDPARAAAFALVVLTGINLFNYIDRNVIAGIEESVSHALDVSDAQFGMFGSSLTIVYMLTAPFFGTLGDRTSRPRLIAVGIALWSLATAAGGFATGFWSMFLARSLVGVGEAAYATIGPTILSDYYPRERRGRVFSIFYAAIPIGYALGYALGGVMERVAGWRAAFWVAGFPGLLLALLALRVWDPPRGQRDAGRPEGPPPGWRSYLELLGNRPYVLIVLGYATYTFALGGLQYWGVGFLVRERGVAGDRAAIQFGIILLAAGLFGTFAGGWLGDRLLRRTPQAYLWVSGVATVLAVPAGFVALLAGRPEVFLPAFFVAEVLAFASTSPINTAIVNVVPPTMRAAAMAGSIFAIHALGDAISPTLIGALSDLTSLRRAVLIVPVALGVGGLVWCWAAWSGRPAAAARG